LKRLASEFDLEIHFRVETDGTKVVRRYVDLIKRIGTWNGREVEFGKDLIGIERKEDFSNIATALLVIGPERDDGTRLEVFVEDKDALARWGRNGQHLVEVYEPESTDQTMTEADLRQLGETELKKRVNSVVEYTSDIVDLEKVPGLEHEKIRFGDTIKIKDTGFEPALYLEARVHTMERSIKKNGYKTVTLGDYIEYTEEQVFAIWKALQAEIAKKVSLSDVMEVTYTKPEIDEKDATVYQDSTQYADTKKDEAIQVAAVDATNKANLAEQAARAYADSLKQQTDQQINDVEQSLSDLDTYVDGAFKDSVIQEAEAKAIEKYLNQLNAEKADIDAKYNDVYNNPSLSGTAKTNLSSKKTAYNTAHTNLINAINAAISDGKTTPAEKSDVDTKFSSYRTALSQLSTAFEDAIDAIAQTKAQQAENNAKSHANSIAEQKKQEAINAAIADAEQKVNQAKTELENELATKVDAQWVNGQLVLKENAITKSNTAPVNPTTGQLWLDTSVTPNVLKRWSGSAWVKATPTSAGEVGAYTKTEVDNALNSKVSVTQYTTDMNGVVTRLNSAESRITQNENEIATKVSSTTYQQDKTTINNNISQLQTKMSNAETSISQLSNQIALKANATDVYTKTQIDGQFSTVNQQISQLNAELSVQAGEIATKVSRTEFESLRIGGRNLLRNSHIMKNTNGGIIGYPFDKSLFILDEDITVSFDARTSESGVTGYLDSYFRHSSAGIQPFSPVFQVTNDWKRYSYTIKVTQEHIDSTETISFRSSASVAGNTTGVKVDIKNVKIERGNRATDWTPAPEDVQGQIDGLGTRVSSAETSIMQMSNQIQLKANQTTVDALTNQISSAQSQINLLSDQIDLKVDKNGVISAINVSSEGVRIDGAKVRITGQTTIDNGVIKTAHIESLTFDKLRGGTATLGGSGNNGSLEVLGADNSVIFRASRDGLIGSGGQPIITKNGLISSFAFLSSGDVNGWQRCGWWDYGGVGQYEQAYIRFRIPVNFTVTNAAIYVYSMPVYISGHPGITTGYYHTRYIKLFKINDITNQFFDMPFASDNYGIVVRSGSATDISNTVWGKIRWDPQVEGTVSRIQVIGGGITSLVDPGYNEFFVKSDSAIQDQRNSSLIQIMVIIEGYQSR